MIEILEGDCVEHLLRFEDGSIDLCVTSPPYGTLRNYNDSLKWDFKGLANELWRVMKDNGVVCWNVGDQVIDGSETLEPFRQGLQFKDIGFTAHDTMIWHKSNFSSPSSNRYHQVFEFIFVLSKGGAPITWNPLKDKKNLWAGTGTFGNNTIRSGNGDDRLEERPRNIIAEFGMRGNVWYGNTRGQEDVCGTFKHPAMMPRWLARDLIYTWSNPGDTVLDPFAGSGTTGEEALKLGRKSILIEKVPEYAELCRHNLSVITPGLPI